MLLANVRWDKAQYPHPPAALFQAILRFLEQLFRLGLAQQGQGQERQAAGLGHGLGKRRRIADTCHGPLEDGVAQPVGAGERAGLSQGVLFVCQPDLLPGAAGQVPQEHAHGLEALGQTGSQGHVLPDQPDALLRPCQDLLPHRLAPFRSLPGHVIGRFDQAFFQPAQFLEALPRQTAQDAIRLAQFFPEQHGFAAIATGQPLPQTSGQDSFSQQQQLRIEDHPGRSRRQAGCGHIQPDAALHVNGHGHALGAAPGQPALQQNKTGFGPNPAARLLALQHQPIGAQRQAGLSFGHVNGFNEDHDATLPQQLDPRSPLGMFGPCQHHRAQTIARAAQQFRPQRNSRRTQLEAKACPRLAPQSAPRRPAPAEHRQRIPDRAGPTPPPGRPRWPVPAQEAPPG